ncbi:MAG: sensor histidine kinase [Rhodobacterales bacterium]|nr:sensor histidine kinase [Rhodobacterales bacterium]
MERNDKDFKRWSAYYPSITRTKIFDRFSQGQESQGAGLGLAIVDEIMSLHEGTVELVHNDPVSFNLTLKR